MMNEIKVNYNTVKKKKRNITKEFNFKIKKNLNLKSKI